MTEILLISSRILRMSESTITIVGFDNLRLHCAFTETVCILSASRIMNIPWYLKHLVGMFSGTYNMRTLLSAKPSQSPPLGHTTYIRTGTTKIPQYSPPEASQLHRKQHMDGNDEGHHESWRTENKTDESLADRLTRTHPTHHGRHDGTPGVNLKGSSLCIFNHMSRSGSYYWIPRRSNAAQ